MKKYLFVLALVLGLGVRSNAAGIDFWISSNTATADTAQKLCPKGNTAKQGHGVISSVCVNTGTAGTFTIYNASAAAVNPIAAIDTASKGCMDYDVFITSGLSYTNSATANVTVTYSCQ